MPRTEHVIRVLVSSPADVANERQVLEDLVLELNDTWSRQLGLRLELLRWETDVLPGVGPEPQTVIDVAVGDDYDAFIGILWQRFGTPTSTHRSGTSQEFERAFSRGQADPSLRVMFYFCEKPVAPSDLDLDQLAQVQRFRAEIGPRGVLWKSYKDSSDFTNLLRLHLSKLAQEWQVRLRDKGGPARASVIAAGDTAVVPLVHGQPPSIPDAQSDEEGLLDLNEVIQEDIASLTTTAERIAEAITAVGAHMDTSSAALNALREAGDMDPGRIKRVVNRAAEDVELFANRIDAETPSLATIYERLVGAVARAAVIQTDFTNGANSLPKAIAAAEALIASTRQAKAGAEGMRAAAAGWPRMSTALNRAKRSALSAMDRLIAEFQRNIEITQAMIDSLNGGAPPEDDPPKSH